MFDYEGGETVPPVGSRLGGLAPGGELAALLEGTDPAGLSDFDLVAALGATERLMGWAQAAQLRVVRELARRRPAAPAAARETHHDHQRRGDGVSEYAHLEIAAELSLSHGAAEQRLDVAMGLDALPGTAAAFAAGRLSFAKVRTLTEELAPLGGHDGLAAAEARLLARAPAQTASRLRACARRAALCLRPEQAAQAEAQARAERRVWLMPASDGMAEFGALLPATDAVALWTVVTAWAEQAKGSGEVRTLDQRRADVVGDLAHLGTCGQLPRRHGRRPEVQVVVGAGTLLGLDQQPGELVGYGPVSAELARDLAGDATWRRILTDPVSGALLDHGTRTYEPPQALADRVIARHRICRFPGCRVPADRCQLDHVIEFPTGPTAETNLGPLSARCHRAKHRGGWQVTLAPDTWTYTWTSPAGHTYTTHVEPLLDIDLPHPHPPDVPDPPDPSDPADPPTEDEDPPF